MSTGTGGHRKGAFNFESGIEARFYFTIRRRPPRRRPLQCLLPSPTQAKTLTHALRARSSSNRAPNNLIAKVQNSTTQRSTSYSFTKNEFTNLEVGHLLPQRVGAHDRADGVAEQLDVIEGVSGHNRLVQVAIEGHLLHVLVGAHLHKRLARGVGAVEHLLQDVEHLVGGPVLAVPLVQVHAQVGLVNGEGAVLGALNNRLGTHAAGLGGKVDALAGALGHVAGGVAHERHAVLRNSKRVLSVEVSNQLYLRRHTVAAKETAATYRRFGAYHKSINPLP
eukprot:2581918-Pyramimonas_sp.AAC.1